MSEGRAASLDARAGGTGGVLEGFFGVLWLACAALALGAGVAARMRSAEPSGPASERGSITDDRTRTREDAMLGDGSAKPPTATIARGFGVVAAIPAAVVLLVWASHAGEGDSVRGGWRALAFFLAPIALAFAATRPRPASR